VYVYTITVSVDENSPLTDNVGNRLSW